MPCHCVPCTAYAMSSCNVCPSKILLMASAHHTTLHLYNLGQIRPVDSSHRVQRLSLSISAALHLRSCQVWSRTICLQALLDAGADLAGKTHMDELAYSLNGENMHYGTPVNPACPSRIPGGSSSGSAVSLPPCIAHDIPHRAELSASKHIGSHVSLCRC